MPSQEFSMSCVVLHELPTYISNSMDADFTAGCKADEMR
jgi:hypothetical protein